MREGDQQLFGSLSEGFSKPEDDIESETGTGKNSDGDLAPVLNELTISGLSLHFIDCCPSLLSYDFIEGFLMSTATVLSKYPVSSWISLELDTDEESVIAPSLPKTNEKKKKKPAAKVTNGRPSFYKIARVTVENYINKGIQKEDLPKPDAFKPSKLAFTNFFRQLRTKESKQDQAKFSALLSGFIVKLAYCHLGLATSAKEIRDYVGSYIFNRALEAAEYCSSYFHYVPVLPDTDGLKEYYPYASFDTDESPKRTHVIKKDDVIPASASKDDQAMSSKEKVRNWQKKFSSKEVLLNDDGQDYDARIKSREALILSYSKEIENHLNLAAQFKDKRAELEREIVNLKINKKKDETNHSLIQGMRTMLEFENEEVFMNVVMAIIKASKPLVKKLMKPETEVNVFDEEEVFHYFQAGYQVVDPVSEDTDKENAEHLESRKRKGLLDAEHPPEKRALREAPESAENLTVIAERNVDPKDTD